MVYAGNTECRLQSTARTCISTGSGIRGRLTVSLVNQGVNILGFAAHRVPQLCCAVQKQPLTIYKQISTTDLSIPIKPFVQRQAMAGFGLSAMVCQSLSSILQTAFALYIFLLMASLRVEVVLILPILQM